MAKIARHVTVADMTADSRHFWTEAQIREVGARRVVHQWLASIGSAGTARV